MALPKLQLPVVFLLVTVAIDAMGIGLILPVMPDLISEVSHRGLSGAAVWGGVLATAYAMMQFLFAPFLGALSDAVGRRRILLATLGLMVVDYVVMAMTNDLTVLLIARIIGGFAAATHSTAFAAMADLSPPEKRTQSFGLIGAAFGLGFVLGPTIGGLLGEFGTRAPFWLAGALAAANTLLGLAAFPETHKQENRRPFNLREANPFGAFKALSRMPGITRGMSIMFLYHVAFAVYPAVWSFFGHARFGWSASIIGISLGIFGLSYAAVQAGIIRLLLRWFGEGGTAVFGLLCAGTAFALIPFIDNGMTVLALTPVAAMGGTLGPAMQGMMSRSLTPDRQGALQGVLSSTAALASVVSPLIMTSVFAAYTAPGRDPFPGAPFLVSLALIFVALGLFLTREKQILSS
ncbi:DHA1 family tetracycline resistance protein-like MFS transporter [Sagittula marina]|uniref:DHA1 family tetracycline resistance protein-like MFS transporter n=1 Tax=Sagittula marina TaxID=943940 RepID=A0A7W6DVN9_9RHOB|nr:TCR/Tet family MFS transporter [Sagittula marina]MBB3986968.1 DHA1 family tetracycline resistance protein-like MFS transporter [Sagittula marina]